MKALAIVFFVLAAVTLHTGIQQLIHPLPDMPEGGAKLAGYVVGTFLIPLVPLLIGLRLWKKAKTEDRDD